jgi:hypothetical protein
MSYSDVIVLLARQRSGTWGILSALEQHPDIVKMNETFNPNRRDSEREDVREQNFYTFMERYADGDVRRLLPDRHEDLFTSYLDFLRESAKSKYLLIDIKYSTSHLLTAPWSMNATVPYLYELIMRHDMKVMNITRRNYLRFFVSHKKGSKSKQFHIRKKESDSYSDHTVRIPVGPMLRELERCDQENQMIAQAFAGYPSYRAYEYADIFPADAPDGIARGFISDVTDWLAISDDFPAVPAFARQSSLPLEETIENYKQVAAALRGTRFEYCLEDEPAYRRSPAEPAAAAPAES